MHLPAMPGYHTSFQRTCPSSSQFAYFAPAYVPELTSIRSPVWHLPPRPWPTQSPTSSSSSSSTFSHSSPPEAPRPRTIPLPNVDDSRGRGRSLEYHRSSSMPPLPVEKSPTEFQAFISPTVDLLLAVPLCRMAGPSLKWDLLYHPTRALLESPYISHSDLSRCAIRSSPMGRMYALQSLVLIFPLLPMEIEVGRPTPRMSRRTSFSEASCLTIGDLIEGLYWGLRAPIEPQELARLSLSEQGTLRRACELRCRCLPEDARSSHALRKIDYLSRRRHFLGIRPAIPYELPDGRRSGEVFVVEVGTGEN